VDILMKYLFKYDSCFFAARYCLSRKQGESNISNF
jgi:hypothetical protein